jgi:hypothetical protein
MTRREREILIASVSWTDKSLTVNEEKAFQVGAKWADKTMLNKVCDWIQCMALDYMQGDITDVKWESMFADLRNYIENGDN